MSKWIMFCAPDNFADSVAQCCYGYYKSMPKTGKPTMGQEWTLLSAVVMTTQTETGCSMKVVGMGTGSKCIGKSKMSKAGDVINDSHAEIIARRSFLCYLYEDLMAVYGGSRGEVFLPPQQQDGRHRCTVKQGVHFHFFTSQTPCGDASIFPRPDEDAVEVMGSVAAEGSPEPKSGGHRKRKYPPTEASQDAAHKMAKPDVTVTDVPCVEGEAAKEPGSSSGQDLPGSRPGHGGMGRRLEEGCCHSQDCSDTAENDVGHVVEKLKSNTSTNKVGRQKVIETAVLTGKEAGDLDRNIFQKEAGHPDGQVSQKEAGDLNGKVFQMEAADLSGKTFHKDKGDLSEKTFHNAYTEGKTIAEEKQPRVSYGDDTCGNGAKCVPGGDIFRTGAKCVPGAAQDQLGSGSDYHIVGLLRIKPGRGERTISMSCSDKMARWNILGVQGALLSLFLVEPIYLSTVVLGSGPYSHAAMSRALIERVEGVTELPKGYRVHAPLLLQSTLSFPDGRQDQQARAPQHKLVPSSAAIICYQYGGVRHVDASVNGKRQGVTSKNLHKPQARCLVCSKELFLRFQSLMAASHTTSSMSCFKDMSWAGLTYNQCKSMAKDYNDAWACLRLQQFSKWLRKDRTLLDFSSSDTSV
ncbi:tRNA-specific adenosine deaminase 1-like [Haliotis rufescens]|uniref:tRNA-specific adenosine deaminase 1-like n=1 Tax=Haliotis rufescens TaxID=6454 RepID=UPI00201EA097|nr:tRNA-specific adenosine deaminase 1-like [Haliotis rufescens]